MANTETTGTDFYKHPAVVEAYGARPGYPQEAIAYILELATLEPREEKLPHRILDGGCGTGLLSQAFLAFGVEAQIVAVDSSEAMMHALTRNIPTGALGAVGSMNRLPIADESVDIAAFGTALHWGDADEVPGELSRVLRPNGIVASISNVTRAGTDFTAIFDSLPGQAAKVNTMTADPKAIDLGAGFEFAGFRQFPNDLLTTRQGYFNLLASIEILHTADSDRLVRAWERLDDYVSAHTIDGIVTVPFDTMVRVARFNGAPLAGQLACEQVVSTV